LDIIEYQKIIKILIPIYDSTTKEFYQKVIDYKIFADLLETANIDTIMECIKIKDNIIVYFSKLLPSNDYNLIIECQKNADILRQHYGKNLKFYKNIIEYKIFLDLLAKTQILELPKIIFNHIDIANLLKNDRTQIFYLNIIEYNKILSLLRLTITRKNLHSAIEYKKIQDKLKKILSINESESKFFNKLKIENYRKAANELRSNYGESSNFINIVIAYQTILEILIEDVTEEDAAEDVAEEDVAEEDVATAEEDVTAEDVRITNYQKRRKEFANKKITKNYKSKDFENYYKKLIDFLDPNYEQIFFYNFYIKIIEYVKIFKILSIKKIDGHPIIDIKRDDIAFIYKNIQEYIMFEKYFLEDIYFYRKIPLLNMLSAANNLRRYYDDSNTSIFCNIIMKCYIIKDFVFKKENLLKNRYPNYGPYKIIAKYQKILDSLPNNIEILNLLSDETKFNETEIMDIFTYIDFANNMDNYYNIKDSDYGKNIINCMDIADRLKHILGISNYLIPEDRVRFYEKVFKCEKIANFLEKNKGMLSRDLEFFQIVFSCEEIANYLKKLEDTTDDTDIFYEKVFECSQIANYLEKQYNIETKDDMFYEKVYNSYIISKKLELKEDNKDENFYKRVFICENIEYYLQKSKEKNDEFYEMIFECEKIIQNLELKGIDTKSDSDEKFYKIVFELFFMLNKEDNIILQLAKKCYDVDKCDLKYIEILLRVFNDENRAYLSNDGGEKEEQKKIDEITSNPNILPKQKRLLISSLLRLGSTKDRYNIKLEKLASLLKSENNKDILDKWRIIISDYNKKPDIYQ